MDGARFRAKRSAVWPATSRPPARGPAPSKAIGPRPFARRCPEGRRRGFDVPPGGCRPAARPLHIRKSPQPGARRRKGHWPGTCERGGPAADAERDLGGLEEPARGAARRRRMEHKRRGQPRAAAGPGQAPSASPSRARLRPPTAAQETAPRPQWGAAGGSPGSTLRGGRANTPRRRRLEPPCPIQDSAAPPKMAALRGKCSVLFLVHRTAPARSQNLGGTVRPLDGYQGLPTSGPGGPAPPPPVSASPGGSPERR